MKRLITLCVIRIFLEIASAACASILVGHNNENDISAGISRRILNEVAQNMMENVPETVQYADNHSTAHVTLSNETFNSESGIITEEEMEDDEEKGISRDFSFTNFFQSFLPSYGTSDTDKVEDNVNSKFVTIPTLPSTDSEGESSQTMRMRNGLSNLLSRLLQNVYIDRNSLFRVQLYNADFNQISNSLAEDSGNESDNKNNYTLTAPNAIFGSPLCFGICLTGQVYSDNGSIRILSDKKYSIFGESRLSALATSSTTKPLSSAYTGEKENGDRNIVSEVEKDKFPSIEERDRFHSESSTETSSSPPTFIFSNINNNNGINKVISWIRVPAGWIYNNTPSLSISINQHTLPSSVTLPF